MGEAPMAQGWQLVLGVGTDGGGVWAVGGGVGHGPRISIAWAICSSWVHHLGANRLMRLMGPRGFMWPKRPMGAGAQCPVANGRVGPTLMNH